MHLMGRADRILEPRAASDSQAPQRLRPLTCLTNWRFSFTTIIFGSEHTCHTIHVKITWVPRTTLVIRSKNNICESEKEKKEQNKQKKTKPTREYYAQVIPISLLISIFSMSQLCTNGCNHPCSTLAHNWMLRMGFYQHSHYKCQNIPTMPGQDSTGMLRKDLRLIIQVSWIRAFVLREQMN